MENQTFLLHCKVSSSQIKQKQVTPEMHFVTVIPQTNLSDLTVCKNHRMIPKTNLSDETVCKNHRMIPQTYLSDVTVCKNHRI